MIYNNKVQNLDVELAKKDVVPYLKDPEQLNVWSREFFLDIIKSITFDE